MLNQDVLINIITNAEFLAEVIPQLSQINHHFREQIATQEFLDSLTHALDMPRLSSIEEVIRYNENSISSRLFDAVAAKDLRLVKILVEKYDAGRVGRKLIVAAEVGSFPITNYILERAYVSNYDLIDAWEAAFTNGFYSLAKFLFSRIENVKEIFVDNTIDISNHRMLKFLLSQVADSYCDIIKISQQAAYLGYVNLLEEDQNLESYSTLLLNYAFEGGKVNSVYYLLKHEDPLSRISIDMFDAAALSKSFGLFKYCVSCRSSDVRSVGEHIANNPLKLSMTASDKTFDYCYAIWKEHGKSDVALFKQLTNQSVLKVENLLKTLVVDLSSVSDEAFNALLPFLVIDNSEHIINCLSGGKLERFKLLYSRVSLEKRESLSEIIAHIAIYKEYREIVSEMVLLSSGIWILPFVTWDLSRWRCS
jgi:hypothetical protein